MIQEKQKLKIIYDGEERIIEPYYLFIYRNRDYSSLYTIGYCHLRNSPRTFKLSRITSRRQLKEAWDYKPFPISQVDLSKFGRSKVTFISFVEDHLELLLFEGYRTQNQLEKLLYPKTIKLSKMPTAAICRSPLEERVIRQYNSDNNVKTILIEPFSIEYRFENMDKKYIPDLLIVYENGTKFIVEIKVSSEISELKNQKKFEAALKYAENNEMHFIIRGMDIQGSNYRETGKFRWQEKTNEHEVQNFDSSYVYTNEIHSYTYEPKTELFLEKRNSYSKILIIIICALILILILINNL